MKDLALIAATLWLALSAAQAQLQVELKFKRTQYIAYEPVIATVNITNLAGRDVELRDAAGQSWFGFEITSDESRFLAPMGDQSEPPLRIAAGQTVVRKVNLTPRFPVHDYGHYHVRAHIFFADLNKFFYSQTKVFQIGDARPIWQRTVGIPEGQTGAGELRTYSLLSNRFADHTSLYVRVEDKSTGAVYRTYSLGRTIAFDPPQAELDRENQLHVLHCSAPRTWAYSEIGLEGQLLSHATFTETKTRPRLRKTPGGNVAVQGGMLDAQVKPSPGSKLSARPSSLPLDD